MQKEYQESLFLRYIFKKKFLTVYSIGFFFLAIFSSNSCFASEVEKSCIKKQKPSLITVGEGFWDVQRGQRRTAEFYIEYLSNLEWYYIRPMIGLIGNNKGGFYSYGGFNIDGVIADCFVIAPSLAVGFYQRGNSKKLGLPLEFRSGLELAWRFENDVRLGAIFYHISNASLGSKNPGTESLVFLLSVPLSFDSQANDSLKDMSN